MKGVMALVFLISVPLAYSISISELLSRYSFSAATQQMNVTSYNDFMIDGNNNGINDTLVFELNTSNSAGTFIFVINLFDKNGVLTNETNKMLSSGINKLNITFASILLSQSQFNYSIKIYNASRKQKYRKDNILTQSYSNYEEGFRVLSLNDSRISKTLTINLAINSPENKSHVTTLFLTYKNLTIFSKGTKQFTSPTSHISFNFDNETIKKTHFIGNFTISSVKIGVKTLKADFSTRAYDFRDFAATSYIYNFTDNGTDSNGDGKYNFLEINPKIGILKAGNYTLALSVYDLFGNLVEMKNSSTYFDFGNAAFPIRINGSLIYDKKLNGPYVVKNAELYDDSAIIDRMTDAYTTGSYNFNDFENDGLPDITANISVSNDYHYGIENITINFTFSNIGVKPAFNIAADMFDNRTFAKSNKSSVLDAGSGVLYHVEFHDISDFEITAIADLQNLVEELNESNNAQLITIKLNKKPVLAPVENITVNETGRILINLSASDSNGDNLTYSINLSKFSNKSNIFEWNTSVADSGNYALKAVASDSYLNDTLSFMIKVLDAPEKDIDNDGIEDSIDRLIGNENSVNASAINLSIWIDNSRNLSKLFSENLRVRFTDGNLPIAEFDFNFSLYKLNLSNITMQKQSANATGSLLARGLWMPEGLTKKLYVDKADNSINGVCIKEEEISSISLISGDCSASNEHKVECDGTLQDSYTCAYNSTLGKHQVMGLRHSGIIQIDYTKSASGSGSSSQASGGGSSGGGGGSAACNPDWQCSEWIACIEGFKRRQCTDKNQCAYSGTKPAEFEPCAGERKVFDIVKPLEYIDNSLKNLKHGIQSKQALGITGRVIESKANHKPSIGIFIVFMEIITITGAYLAIRRLYFKNI